MSRRIEITVPNEWAVPVRECLEDKQRCNLGDHSEKPNMIVELKGDQKTVFFVTLPGPAIGAALEILRKNGFGVKVGRIILSTVEYMKPGLDKPLQPIELTSDQSAAAIKKAAALKGFQQFVKARRTTEELFNEISNGATMTINTWFNLIGASLIAAGGLATNTTVFIVAAMLVSPIMGPILGMTFGYRVADWPLFKAGFWNEMKMAVSAFAVGLFSGMLLGGIGNTYKWPNSAMMPEGQGFNLIISILVSAAAGMVLAVSLSSPVTNALVGTAISAGLLPPLVNAGMLIAYAAIYAPLASRGALYEMGGYSLLFYISHVVTIVVVANIVFWLKDIDPRFRQGDDADFDDIPSLREHKEKLLKDGKAADKGEGVKFKNFMSNAIKDLRTDAVDGLLDIKDGALGLANKVRGVFTGDHTSGRGHSQSSAPEYGGTADGDVEMGQINENVFFKRHKLQVSPNLLAEEELEKGVLLGAGGYHTIDKEDSVLNPLHFENQDPGNEGDAEEQGGLRHRPGPASTSDQGGIGRLAPVKPTTAASSDSPVVSQQRKKSIEDFFL